MGILIPFSLACCAHYGVGPGWRMKYGSGWLRWRLGPQPCRALEGLVTIGGIMSGPEPYESTGRTAQKNRTRKALIDAARALIVSGITPTVEDAAAAASISRTTAYRYFPIKTGVRWITISSTSPAFRHCWSMLAPNSITLFSPAASLASDTARSMLLTNVKINPSKHQSHLPWYSPYF